MTVCDFIVKCIDIKYFVLTSKKKLLTQELRHILLNRILHGVECNQILMSGQNITSWKKYVYSDVDL